MVLQDSTSNGTPAMEARSLGLANKSRLAVSISSLITQARFAFIACVAIF